MESEFYSLLNSLFKPKKLPVILSIIVMISFPVILEIFLIMFYMQEYYEAKLILSLESASVLLGYFYVYLFIKICIKRSLHHYKEKFIFQLVGSLPALIYLLSPGIISLTLGILLLNPAFTTPIGRKIMRACHIDPSVIHTLLELNYSS